MVVGGGGGEAVLGSSVNVDSSRGISESSGDDVAYGSRAYCSTVEAYSISYGWTSTVSGFSYSLSRGGT